MIRLIYVLISPKFLIRIQFLAGVKLLEPAPQGMVGAEGASSGQQRGRDLLGPLNTTSILTSESQLALSDLGV